MHDSEIRESETRDAETQPPAPAAAGPAPSADVTARPQGGVTGPNTKGLLIACGTVAAMIGLALFLTPRAVSDERSTRAAPRGGGGTFLDREPVAPEADPRAPGEPWWADLLGEETGAAPPREPEEWETPSEPPPPPDPRERTFERALRSAVYRDAGARGAADSPETESQLTEAIRALTSPEALRAGLGQEAPVSPSSLAAGAHLPATRAGRLPTLGPRTLRAGSVLIARLETAIDSDAPGPIAARVIRPVVDSATGRELLIPAGARLLGTTDSRLALGGGKVLVTFERLLLPDRTYELPGLGAGRPDGTRGLSGRVDRHLLPNLGRAALLAVVGAGFQLGQPRSTGGNGLSSREIVAAQVGLELDRVASQILSQGFSRRPSIKVRAGTRIAIYVHRDLEL